MLKLDLIKENNELKAILKGWIDEVDACGEPRDWEAYDKTKSALGIIHEDLVEVVDDLRRLVADALGEVEDLGGMPVPWKAPVNAFSDYLDTTLGAINSLLEDS